MQSMKTFLRRGSKAESKVHNHNLVISSNKTQLWFRDKILTGGKKSSGR